MHRSAEIAYMTSLEGIKKLTNGTGTFTDNNLVYAGGGHTVLEFSDENNAVSFGRVYTRKVHEELSLLMDAAKSYTLSGSVSAAET